MSDLNKPNINLSYLEEIADGSTEFLLEMITIFLNQTPEYLSQIEQAIALKDWQTVAEISHKIRPTFAFIGAEDAKEAMAKIEHAARSGENLEGIAPVFREVQQNGNQLFISLLRIKHDLEKKTSK